MEEDNKEDVSNEVALQNGIEDDDTNEQNEKKTGESEYLIGDGKSHYLRKNKNIKINNQNIKILTGETRSFLTDSPKKES